MGVLPGRLVGTTKDVSKLEATLPLASYGTEEPKRSREWRMMTGGTMCTHVYGSYY